MAAAVEIGGGELDVMASGLSELGGQRRAGMDALAWLQPLLAAPVEPASMSDRVAVGVEPVDLVAIGVR